MLSQLAVGRLAGMKLPLSRNCRIGAVGLQKSCKPPAPISWRDYERHADPSAPATLTLDQPRDDGSVVSISTCRRANAFGSAEYGVQTPATDSRSSALQVGSSNTLAGHG